METVQQEVSVQDALSNMASADPENFSAFFRKIRKTFPAEATQACLCYLAQKGLDASGQKMALWLAAEVKYFKVLFDNSALPFEIVSRASAALLKADPQFLSKFLKEVEPLSTTPQIVRALNIAPATADSALMPWLKKLTAHSDDRIRSRAVKLLCEIRPNKSQIERQMLDENARVRANAIEALWRLKTAEATELFKLALGDSNHRVVGNALVGLHFQGDPEAMARMSELCQSPHVAFRRAMAWCLGFIEDQRGIPLLQTLSKDPAPVVRNRALRSLLALQPAEAASPETVAA
jgi:HEAT repeat protein